MSAQALTVDGTERFDLAFGEPLRRRQPARLGIELRDGRRGSVPLLLRIDTPSKRPTSWQEGIMPYALEQLFQAQHTGQSIDEGRT